MSNKPKIQLFSKTRAELEALRRINAEAKGKSNLPNNNQYKSEQGLKNQPTTESNLIERKDKIVIEKPTTRNGGVRNTTNKPKIQLFSKTRAELEALRRINAEEKSRRVSQNVNQYVSDEKQNTQSVVETDSAVQSVADKYAEENRRREEKEAVKKEKAKQKELDKTFKKVEKALARNIKKEDKELRKLSKRITPPKEHRTFFNRLGNIISLNQHEYDVYKDDIKDYKNGKMSREDIELVWEEIQEYEDAKSDIKLRAAWGAFKLALTGIGLAAAVHFGGQFLNSAYEYGQNMTQGFWDETKQNMEEQREQYELLYGDYLPNGEKKRQLTAEEYESLTPEQKKYITYIPSIGAELSEDEDGNYTVTLDDNETKEVNNTNTTQDNIKNMER